MASSQQVPSERDLELLSAYLDGELAPRERAALEQRLAQDPALRAALQSLRETVALVHQLPRLKAPRSFTLDPAVYGRVQPVGWRRFLAPGMALQLSGALGAAASIVLITLGLWWGQGDTSRRSASDLKNETGQQTAQATPEQLAFQPTPLTENTLAPSATSTPAAAEGFSAAPPSDEAGAAPALGMAGADEGDTLLAPTVTILDNALESPGEEAQAQGGAQGLVSPAPAAVLLPTPTLRQPPTFTANAYETQADSAFAAPQEAAAPPVAQAAPAASLEQAESETASGALSAGAEQPALPPTSTATATLAPTATMTERATRAAPSPSPQPVAEVPTAAKDQAQRSAEKQPTAAEPADRRWLIVVGAGLLVVSGAALWLGRRRAA